jgi:hypothetical protein
MQQTKLKPIYRFNNALKIQIWKLTLSESDYEYKGYRDKGEFIFVGNKAT